MSDWREDPDWQPASYDPAAYPDGCPPKPTSAAELADPPIWCSEYQSGRPVATWHRIDPRLDGIDRGKVHS